MRLKEAIGLLSSSEQEVISLLVSRDLPLPEIASVLDIPLNTVKSHIHRAKSKLREYLTTTTSTRRENR
jgi:RNA polymerase sigma-70 factor (ECF subfamily)